MVRIRLSRMGRPHRPFYRINAVEKRNKRDGRVLENLGWYNPMDKHEDKQVELKEERIKHWLEHGAQPSETVADLLAKANIIDAEQRKAHLDAKFTRKREAQAKAKAEAEEAARIAAEAEAKAKAEEEAKAKAEAEAKAAEEASAAAEGGEEEKKDDAGQ